MPSVGPSVRNGPGGEPGPFGPRIQESRRRKGLRRRKGQGSVVCGLMYRLVCGQALGPPLRAEVSMGATRCGATLTLILRPEVR